MNNEQTITTQQQRLAALYDVSARLAGVLDLSQLSNLVLETVIRLTGAERGFLALVDDPTGEFEMLAEHNPDQETIEGSLMASSRTIVQRTVSMAELILSDDARTDVRFAGYQDVSSDPPCSVMCAPLRAQGCIIGAAYVDNRLEPALFSREDLELLAAFANQAAMAIENARLSEKVHKANKQKADFVSLVSHELRIPMTSIRGYTDLLLGEMVGPLTEPQKQFLETIKRNLDRMAVLVRDLSDINRIESGRQKFDMSEFDLREVVQGVARDMQEAIAARRQTLTLHLPESLPSIDADRTRIRQVISNLINNAHMYTAEEGQVAVQVRQEGEQVRVDVIDNGIGISPADQVRIFTQFFRADDEMVREQLGWGLGLALVKALVEAHGGEVGFVSERGQGSTFTVVLPLQPVLAGTDSPAEVPSREGPFQEGPSHEGDKND